MRHSRMTIEPTYAGHHLNPMEIGVRIPACPPEFKDECGKSLF
jgi:hypothetical protein